MKNAERAQANAGSPLGDLVRNSRLRLLSLFDPVFRDFSIISPFLPNTKSMYLL